ncbi:TetR/AcrR family transcriptional regulator [Anianabacter salinae]|uniref:TetR/AcrR family transcriptional regulator n=1 Tax=Anianabacter salinae TaxID=2851023 RepID=UPI00225DFCA2|nr:TetR/AcrR family transcriptional regulator [Anianabacter salinae]
MDTRDALRDAAEELYAEKGIDGVTTRGLAERAGVNMAAVNYHFRNKDNLTLEVFRDVARRTVKRRLDSLARIEAEAATENRAPHLWDVVEAFVDAYVNDDTPRTGILLAHLVLQHRVRPTEWTRAIVAQELDDFALRYMAVLHRAVPHLNEREVHWRYHLMVGAVMMSLSDQRTDGRMKRLSDGLANPEDRSQFRQELISFLVASFGSPCGGDGP